LKAESVNSQVASVIDIGSNTIKFLVAQGPALKVLDETTDDTRIGVGMGMSEKIVLCEAAMNAALECVLRLRKRAGGFNPTREAIVATSAVRDAANGAVFVEKVRAATGITLQILTGEEEAQYVGEGVAMDPNIDSRKPFYLMDLGGGSLELLEFGGGIVRQKVSLPLGAVRLKEKLVKNPSAPMSKGEISEVSEYVTETVDASGFSFQNPGAMVGTGGGLTHARFIIGAGKGLKPHESGAIVTIQEMRALMRKIAAMDFAERCALPKLPPARADIMPVAMIVLTTIMDLATAGSVVHSFYNLRYGLAAEMLGCGAYRGNEAVRD
jgi:exopolyphosphatase / guanosine-5'-triphosphate,3'-diphosphate pyrophosphatase